jgi:Cytochrome c oxidase biogenesis protein Cmc1 like
MTSTGNEIGTAVKFKFRLNSLEERLSKDWSKRALELCDAKVRNFWLCQEREGMFVILNCRNENKDLNSCLTSYTNDTEEYRKWKDKRVPELIAEASARMSDDEERAAVLRAAGLKK